MVKALKVCAFVLLAYLLVVVGIETFVVYMGKSHAERGVSEDEDWLTLTTQDEAGKAKDSIMGGVRIDNHLYVAANHWPRAWLHRAIARPDVLVTLDGVQSEYRVGALEPTERERVAEVYKFPFLFRMLTGFPPRVFLRLDPKTGQG